jgi:D-sedoheptulose 7-phosphate isomerase
MTIQAKIASRQAIWQEWGSTCDLSAAFAVLERAVLANATFLAFGNGGSATQASHFVAELVNRYYRERRALAALALTCDIANITSIGNDRDYSVIFSRQIEALGRPGDVAIGLSTSGTSPNVLKGFAVAKRQGLTCIGLCGRRTQAFADAGVDVVIGIPADDTPLVQELHLFVLHMFADFIESKA